MGGLAGLQFVCRGPEKLTVVGIGASLCAASFVLIETVPRPSCGTITMLLLETRTQLRCDRVVTTAQARVISQPFSQSSVMGCDSTTSPRRLFLPIAQSLRRLNIQWTPDPDLALQ